MCPPSSFLPVSQLIKFLSRMMSMAGITWSSVCIPAVMAFCESDLWVNSLITQRNSAIVGCWQDHLGFGISCCLWQSTVWIQLYYTWSQAESRNGSDVLQCPGCVYLLCCQSANRMVCGKGCLGFLVTPQKHLLEIFMVLAGLMTLVGSVWQWVIQLCGPLCSKQTCYEQGQLSFNA